MKIMVLYAQAGGGHKKAAEAIAEMARLTEGVSAVMVDALAEINKVVDCLICDGYQLMAKYVPKAFGLLYKRANDDTPLADLMPLINEKVSHCLLPIIEAYQPDVIISTYHFAAEMVSFLKEKNLYQGRLICVITDYGLHKAWLAKNVDAYVTACEEMTASMLAAGVSEEKIYSLGIPVKSAFREVMPKAQARQILGILPDKMMILLMAGSFGVHKVLDVYRQIAALAGNFQIVVICGRNEKLYRTFSQEIKQYAKPTKIVGFTNRVAAYMQAADLLVTKSGGLTVSEALATHLPMIVFDAIPGQEEDNADFLMGRGIALSVGKELSASDAVAYLLANPVQFQAMQQAANDFNKADSANAVITLAQTLFEATKEEKYVNCNN